ncbi:uncharacterized protein LOC106512240, partial [Austrofundulus limnaeus]|uniref:Uncharacterized protein LOC106512240 n=1 Tax=Austrofundulus limnaeus TaxID=52670 RepID=A0A2I4ALL5_AUSLI
MALFNRLAHPSAKPAEGSRGDTRQRRANSRFQTQPITQGEVEQLKNGGEIKLEPLPASLARSVTAITSQASVTTVTMVPLSSSISDGFPPGKSAAVPYIPAQQQVSSSANVHQERAPKYFSLTQGGHPEPELIPSPLLLERSPETGGPSSSSSLKQQEEAVAEGWREQREEEAEVGGRLQGGAREGSLHSSDRDREDRLQHPQLSAESSFRRGEPEPLPGRGATDPQEGREKGEEGGGRGKRGHLREAAAAEEVKGSSGRSQGGVSSDLPDHPAPLKPLIAKVSSRTVSYISTGQQRPAVIQPPPTLPKPPLYIQPSSYSQPPQTHPKSFTHSSQTQSRPQGFTQNLP